MGASYQIRLFDAAEDIDQTIEEGDRYILETAEEAGMNLPCENFLD